MSRRNRIRGDVDWHLPNAKKPFASSTRATSDLIEVLYKDYGDLALVYAAINFDDEAKKIVKYYLDRGIRHIHIRSDL